MQLQVREREIPGDLRDPGPDALPTLRSLKDPNAEIPAPEVPVDLVDDALPDDASVRRDQKEETPVLIIDRLPEKRDDLLPGKDLLTAREARRLPIQGIKILCSK